MNKSYLRIIEYLKNRYFGLILKNVVLLYEWNVKNVTLLISTHKRATGNSANQGKPWKKIQIYLIVLHLESKATPSISRLSISVWNDVRLKKNKIK